MSKRERKWTKLRQGKSRSYTDSSTSQQLFSPAWRDSSHFYLPRSSRTEIFRHIPRLQLSFRCSEKERKKVAKEKNRSAAAFITFLSCKKERKRKKANIKKRWRMFFFQGKVMICICPSVSWGGQSAYKPTCFASSLSVHTYIGLPRHPPPRGSFPSFFLYFFFSGDEKAKNRSRKVRSPDGRIRRRALYVHFPWRMNGGFMLMAKFLPASPFEVILRRRKTSK